MAQVDKVVDARGSFCPGPLMEIIKAMKTAQVGQVIEVLSNDAGSVKDIPEWVKKTGHELVHVEEAGDHWKLAIKKTK